MLRLIDITKTYRHGGRETHALRGVSLDVPDGSVFGVIGRSGAGKSTLIRVINLLERPTTGTVELDGVSLGELSTRELRATRRRIGMIFQHFDLLHTRTARENIAFPLEIQGVPRAERRARVDELIDLVGLAGREDNYPSQLSGGQQQRVGIARALAAGPSILLADEATSALDTETTQQILALLRDINRRLGVTIVLITHELDVIRRVATHVASIEDGRLTESGRLIDLIGDPDSALGSAILAESGDDGAPGDRRLRVTSVGAGAGHGLLADLAIDLGLRFEVRSGGVLDLADARVTSFELGLPAVGPDRGDEAVAYLSARGVRVERLDSVAEVLR